jgi:transcription elongation factor Elf1
MKDLEADLQCPNCRRKLKIKVKEMVPGHTKPCPYCGLEIQFTGDDGRKAQKALDDLQRTFKRFSKR